MFKLVVASMALVTAVALPAWADSAAGAACAAKLTPDGQAIYAAVIAAKPTTQTLMDTMETQTKSLAMNGKIARGSARDNARAARDCVTASLN